MLKHPIEWSHLGYDYLTPIKSLWRKGFHTGLDLNGPGSGNDDLGTPIHALGKGKVIFTNKFIVPGWGRMVVIEHRFIDEKGQNRTVWGRYAHLNEIRCYVNQEVDDKTVIATLGKTGTQFAHLHFDMFKVNPKGNYYQYIWGWNRDRVAGYYANIHFMVANWNNV